MTTPCRFSHNLGFCPPNLGFFGDKGARGGPKWFGRLIYTIDGMKKPPGKFQKSAKSTIKIPKNQPEGAGGGENQKTFFSSVLVYIRQF